MGNKIALVGDDDNWELSFGNEVCLPHVDLVVEYYKFLNHVFTRDVEYSQTLYQKHFKNHRLLLAYHDVRSRTSPISRDEALTLDFHRPVHYIDNLNKGGIQHAIELSFEDIVKAFCDQDGQSRVEVVKLGLIMTELIIDHGLFAYPEVYQTVHIIRALDFTIVGVTPVQRKVLDMFWTYLRYLTYRCGGFTALTLRELYLFFLTAGATFEEIPYSWTSVVQECYRYVEDGRLNGW